MSFQALSLNAPKNWAIKIREEDANELELELWELSTRKGLDAAVPVRNQQIRASGGQSTMQYHGPRW
jgi:hypothetical protein